MINNEKVGSCDIANTLATDILTWHFYVTAVCVHAWLTDFSFLTVRCHRTAKIRCDLPPVLGSHHHSSRDSLVSTQNLRQFIPPITVYQPFICKYTPMLRRCSFTRTEDDSLCSRAISRKEQSSPMKKARSLDFSRLVSRSTVFPGMTSDEARRLASPFSRKVSTESTHIRAPSKEDYSSYLHEESFASWGATSDEVADITWNHSDSSSSEGSIQTTTKLTLGKISVIVLVLATLFDFAFSQLHHLDAPDLYEALSADVIRPPFKYIASNVRPRSGLGSAAISSVTEALSPILPFTGGMDLRREDYWTSSGNWLETLQSVTQQVRDAFSSQAESNVETIPRGGGNVPERIYKQLHSRRTKHVPTLSTPQPFVGTDVIADLTLAEIADVFRYALESSNKEFNENRFVNELSPRVRKVIQSLKEAVAKSRGKDVKDLTCSNPKSGDIDALKFSAAMRIFAEWRVIRQVPEGYKSFAVGMNLGHRDIVQNVAKIEQTVHSWLDHRQDIIAMHAMWEQNGIEGCSIDGKVSPELRTPSLREIMEFEIEMDINPVSRLPRLKDKTGAMGLLWVRRQLQYQTLLFDNVLQVPQRFRTTPDAVAAAYKEVYDRFHGWAVQKIFNYSFQSAPATEEIYRHMNPHKLKEVTEKARTMKSSTSNVAFESSPFEDAKEDNPVIGFFKQIGGEWDKMAGNVARIFGADDGPVAELNLRGGSGTGLQSKEFEDFVTAEMTKDAHGKIQAYLSVAFPLLDDLSRVFDELNMDDPTKV